MANIAQSINNAVEPASVAINNIIFYKITLFDVAIPVVVIWLILAALILTVSLRFINIRSFGHAWHLTFHREPTNPNTKGEISHFQALTSALSGTVGLGNIASVPIAIVLGGPGALFWMVLAGILGMSSKFAECALAVKYRRTDQDGRVHGGPMYYIEDIVAKRAGKLHAGFGKGLGKFSAVFFAVMTMGASISVFQVNQAHSLFADVTGHSIPLTFGIIMASGVAIVIVSGIKTIGRVTSILVPLMGAIYLSAGLTIIFANISAVPGAIMLILKGAFGLEAAGGGLVGALIIGIQRATYSSEAGVGSAAIAHAAVRTDNPLTEGYVALLEPFIDTVVICSVTALVIIVTGVYEPFVGQDNLQGIVMTSAAFESMFSWYPVILLISVILFAFSTLIAWAYYGAEAAAYLFGTTKRVDIIFKLLLCLALSTGAAIQLSAIVNFIDAMLFGMCIPNIIALYLLLPELKSDVRAYETARK